MNFGEPFSTFCSERSEDHDQNLYQPVVMSRNASPGECSCSLLVRKGVSSYSSPEMSETEWSP